MQALKATINNYTIKCEMKQKKMDDWSMYLYQGCLIIAVPGESTANYKLDLCKLVIIKFIKLS